MPPSGTYTHEAQSNVVLVPWKCACPSDELPSPTLDARTGKLLVPRRVRRKRLRADLVLPVYQPPPQNDDL